MRLFLALWPDSDARANLEEIHTRLRERIDRQGVRFTKPERIHLTLRFIGDVGESKLPELEAAIRCIEHPGVKIETTTLGAFPGLHRPKVVWLGLQGEGLQNLHATVQGALSSVVDGDAEEFVPHLTLARVNPGSKEVGWRLRRLIDEAGLPKVTWQADRLSLVETLPSSAYEEKWSHRLV